MPIRELLSDEVLDVLLAQSKDEAGQLRLTGEDSMLGRLVKAVLERALEAELTAHLGYGKHDVAGNNSGNLLTHASALSFTVSAGSAHGGTAVDGGHLSGDVGG